MNWIKRNQIDGTDAHYVAQAHEFTVDCGIGVTPDEQHAELRWWPLDQLMASTRVNANTKAYY